MDNGTGEPPPRHHHQRMADKLVLGSDAIARGECNWKQLGRKFQPIYRNVYLPLGVELTAETKAHAAWLSTGATLAGLSAAAIYRTKWIDADRPAEIVRPDRHHQPGMISHSWTLNDGEIWVRNGMRVTTPVRTGDAVSIKNVYHTNVAAPGTRIAFVWMMAAVREEADRVFSVVHVQPEFDGKFKLF